jgi:hypothetical protein
MRRSAVPVTGAVLGATYRMLEPACESGFAEQGAVAAKGQLRLAGRCCNDVT